MRIKLEQIPKFMEPGEISCFGLPWNRGRVIINHPKYNKISSIRQPTKPIILNKITVTLSINALGQVMDRDNVFFGHYFL
jgi:hypothetical protein